MSSAEDGVTAHEGAPDEVSGGDDEWVCSVCFSDDTDEQNPLIMCDGCGVCAHRECYGNPLLVKIPDDDWFCDKCVAGCPNASCELCPASRGAMKRTTDFKWVHLSCAMWIPEVFFRQSDARDPIDYFQVPAHRFGNDCCFCDSTEGATMTCSSPGCSRAFHITCAFARDTYFDYKVGTRGGADLVEALCEEHAKKLRAKKQR